MIKEILTLSTSFILFVAYSQDESRVVVESYYDSILQSEVKLILYDRENWGPGENNFSLQIDTETHGRETIIAVGGSVAISKMGEHLEGKFTPNCNSSKHKLTLIYNDPDGETKFLHTFKLGDLCKEE